MQVRLSSEYCCSLAGLSNPPAAVWSLCRRAFHGENRLFDVAKHWWGLKATSLGYAVLYSDIDAVLRQDPLARLAATGPQPAPGGLAYDVEALSDLDGPADALPGFMLGSCRHYMLVRDRRAPGGGVGGWGRHCRGTAAAAAGSQDGES